MARNPHAASNVNDKDERQHRFTPRKLIQALHDEFHFTMDACGHPLSPASQIIGAGYTLVPRPGFLLQGNCYMNGWGNETVWLQPDFSELTEAVQEASGRMRGIYAAYTVPPKTVVLLMPWNRQEQPEWHTWIEPYRDGKGRLIDMLDREVATLSTRAIKGRVKFGTPSDPEGVKKHPKRDRDGNIVRYVSMDPEKDGQPVMMPNAPGFGCGLVIWRRNN